jgi:hypothetical protein
MSITIKVRTIVVLVIVEVVVIHIVIVVVPGVAKWGGLDLSN